MKSMLCSSCHTDQGTAKFAGRFPYDMANLKYPADGNYKADTVEDLALYLEEVMPYGTASTCDADCARDIAAYLWTYVPNPSTPGATPLSTPTPLVTSTPTVSMDQCDKVAQCRVTWPAATFCARKDAADSVCMCGTTRCDSSPVSTPVPTPTPTPTPTPPTPKPPTPAPSVAPTPKPPTGSACDDALARGNDIYNSGNFNCASCHGVPDGSAKTPGFGNSPRIAILEPPYGGIGSGTPSEATLDLYIEKHMSIYFGTNCKGTTASCADDVAAYLLHSAGDKKCPIDFGNGNNPGTNPGTTPTPTPTPSSIPDSPIENTVVLAINTGGLEVDVEGESFDADTGFTGGNDLTRESIDIANTDADALFSSERWGASKYSLSLPDNNYEIEFGFVELVPTHKAGDRVFDVVVEGTKVLSKLDVTKEAGAIRKALIKKIKNVQVTDGKLDIHFNAITHNPTISYIKVSRPEFPSEQYDRMCASCHGGPNGEDRSELGNALVASECKVCGNKATLEAYINAAMPFQFPKACTGSCATRMANYIHNKFAGYGSNPDVKLPPFLEKSGNASACGTPNTDFNHMRRIASVDYNHIVADLFGVKGDFTESFSADQKVGNFFINSDASPDLEQIRQYFSVAKTVADEALSTKSTWLACAAKTTACVKQTIEQVGRRAFARPLTTQETNAFVTGYEEVEKTYGYDSGLSVLVQSLLTSPQFLYRIESGEGSGNVVPLTQYELAARLAMFLWRSVPDDTLLDLAKNGKLATDAQLKQQAIRMLNDAKAARMTSLFHREWMHIQEPPKGIDDFDQQVSAIVDFNRTVNELIFKDDASYSDLFTVNYGFVNADIKSLYGASGSPLSNGNGNFEKYALDANQRGGLLQRLPFLRSNPSPVHRGLFIREHLLCGTIPAPPAGAAAKSQPANDKLTPRELFALHTKEPTCGGCHVLMDPLDYPLDHFDASGVWRDRYPGNGSVRAGFNVDDSGNFLLTDVDGDFKGGREMQDILASSNDVKECYNFHWFEFAVGRQASRRDTCSLSQMNTSANAAGGSIKDVLIAIVLSDSFRYHRKAP